MTSLGDAALALLHLTEVCAGDAGITLPDRRYVTPGVGGAEAWDGEQVTVGLVQLGAGPASLASVEAGSRSGAPRGAAPLAAALLRVEIVRCAPVPTEGRRGAMPTAPAPEDQTAAALVLLADAQLLHTVRSRALTDATLTGGFPGDVRVGPVTPAGPDGALAAVALQVAVTLL